MGWRDRDWAKLDDDERRRLFGTARADPQRGSSLVRRSKHVALWTLVAAVATGIAVWATGHLTLASNAQVSPLALPSPIVRQQASNVIGIRWRPIDLAPAPRAGRICVSAARHPRVCASYVVGERPADNLTRELARRGLRVRSSG